jgi:nucleotide-binding universal stress UspA family protein
MERGRTMTPITSILAATDFSADGNNAVRRAALLAHTHGARLHIVHVLEPAGCPALRDWFTPSIDIDLKSAQARATLRGHAAEIAGRYDVAASTEVCVGDTLGTLMQASERADLVVLGQRGHGGLRAWLVGRTVDRLLRTCRRPVLVVKRDAEAPYRRVLMPIDFTPGSDVAIRFAARLARGPSLSVFHAIDSHRQAILRRADVSEPTIEQARAREEAGIGTRMRRQVAGLGLDGTHMSYAVGDGSPAQATLRQARAQRADLIVAGKQGRSHVGGFLLGSVSSRVLSGSECDVLIVPAAGRESGASARPLCPRGRDAPAARALPHTAPP